MSIRERDSGSLNAESANAVAAREEASVGLRSDLAMIQDQGCSLGISEPNESVPRAALLG